MPAFRFHQSLISTGEAYTVSPVFHASHRKTQTLISDTFTVYFEMTLHYLFDPCESEACACLLYKSAALTRRRDKHTPRNLNRLKYEKSGTVRARHRREPAWRLPRAFRNCYSLFYTVFAHSDFSCFSAFALSRLCLPFPYNSLRPSNRSHRRAIVFYLPAHKDKQHPRP